MSDKVFIQVSGPEHSGKTTVAVLVAKYLESLGATVHLQKGDPQIDDKMEKSVEELSTRLGSVDVTLMEMQTGKAQT